MTRTEAFEKAWRLGADKQDFSLADMPGMRTNVESTQTT